MQLAGVEDIYTASSGSTKTLENTLKATFIAVSRTYSFLTPDLWAEKKLIRSPLDEFADAVAARLAAGELEVAYGTAEARSRAAHQAFDETFARMNAAPPAAAAAPRA